MQTMLIKIIHQADVKFVISIPLSVDPQEMAELQERLKTVEDEHAKLVGHHNHKQKIHFHLALKEENNNLREVSSRFLGWGLKE